MTIKADPVTAPFNEKAGAKAPPDRQSAGAPSSKTRSAKTADIKTKAELDRLVNDRSAPMPSGMHYTMPGVATQEQGRTQKQTNEQRIAVIRRTFKDRGEKLRENFHDARLGNTNDQRLKKLRENKRDIINRSQNKDRER